MADPTTTHEVFDQQGNVVESTVVPKPPEQFNEETILERAALALSNNADFLALPSPTQAQAVLQVRALTRQMNGLIRLQLRALDSIDDA